MMDILDRFLVKEFFKFFLLVTLGMAVLFLGIDFLANLWRTDMPTSRSLYIYALKIPEAIQQFVPLGCLLGTLLVLSTMSRQNEILALYTSGIGTIRVVSTFVAIVATVSTLSFLVFDSLVPTLAKKQMAVRQGLDSSASIAPFSANTGIWYRSKHLIYNVGRFDTENNTLENITVYVMNPSFDITRIIHAQKGTYIANDWELRNGYVVTYDPETRFPNLEKFDSRRDVIPEKPTDFKTLEVHEGTMRLKDLRKYIDRNQNFGLDTTAQLVHYHERIALVFAPLIFLLLAVPFAMKPLQTHQMAKSIALCFAVIFLYLLLFRTSLSVGKGGHISPIIAAWSPNVIFLSFAAMMLSRKS